MISRCFAAFFIFVLICMAIPSQAQDAPRLRDAPPEYLATLREAVAAFTARDFPKTLQLIDAAEVMLPPNPLTLNTRGAVLIEQKQYVEGEEYCRKALAIDPQFYPARFNLCEVPLLQKHYAEARELFLKLLEENPKDETAQFRVLLTWLLEKNDGEARKVLEAIPFPGNSCAYYYGNAAWAFAHGEEEEGNKWVMRGNWVFTPEQTGNFSLPFIEIGWLKREPGPSNGLPGAYSPAAGTSVPFELSAPSAARAP